MLNQQSGRPLTNRDMERYRRIRDPGQFYALFSEENSNVSHQLFNFRSLKRHGIRNVSASKLNNVPSNLMKSSLETKMMNILHSQPHTDSFQRAKQAILWGTPYQNLPMRSGPDDRDSEYMHTSTSKFRIEKI